MTVTLSSTKPLAADPASYVAPADTRDAAAQTEPQAGTVALAENITLYTSKDRKHANPLTMNGMAGEYVKFVDTKGKEYKYAATDKPTVFQDAKGRNVYVLDSKEHREAVAALRDKADNHGKALRDTALPKYVTHAAALGAITGGSIGGAAAGVPGALVGAVAGAAVVGGPAAGIANVMLHKDQFILRDKVAVLQETGVMRRAETLRDACVHSGQGKRAALYECLLSSVDDTATLAGEHASTQLAALAVQPEKTGATAPA